MACFFLIGFGDPLGTVMAFGCWLIALAFGGGMVYCGVNDSAALNEEAAMAVPENGDSIALLLRVCAFAMLG
jgi:hypothetical protein